MSSKMEPRIFVGGLSWDTTEHHLEDAFSRFGKVVEAQIMLERDTGRPRGFGFVTFTDQHALEEAITEMHGRELSGRVISVNKAQPKVNSDDTGGYGYGGSGGGGRSYRYNDRPPPSVGNSECFKCGRTGHWARECPSAGGGGKFLSRPRFGGGGDMGARFGSDRDDGRYIDDRYDGGDRDHVDSRDRYDSGRDRYSDRYPTGGDRYSGDRYGGSSDRYPPSNGYGRDRNYERDGGPRGRGGPNNGYGLERSYEIGGRGDVVDRYRSGGPSRYEGGGSYRERPGPYDRPSREGSGRRPSSYEDRYA